MLSETSKTDVKRKASELAKAEKRLASLDQDFKKNLEYLKKGLLTEEEFAKANTFQRDERTRTKTRLGELREELETTESAQASATALPGQIKSFVESFEELETSKAKAILQTILKSANIWTRDKVELEFR